MTIKKFAVTMFFSLCLLFIVNINAQESTDQKSRFGLGFSILNFSDSNEDVFSNPKSTIYMTIDLGANFRLEPEFGFDIGEDYYVLGIGIFGKKSKLKYNILYGARFERRSDVSKYVTIAPTFSGEYFPIRYFSISGEVFFKAITDFGDNFEKYTGSNVILRFYF